MKNGSTTRVMIAVLLAGTAGLFGEVARGTGKIEKKTYFFEEAKKDMEYALYVPKSYRKSAKSPLVILLHGLGSNPRQIIRYGGVTGEAEKRGYIVAAPFGYNERGWYGSRGRGKEGPFFGQKNDPANLGELSEKDVMNVLKIVRENYNIDETRIFLMGHSMGGGGTVYLGATYPKIWAGLAPLAPALHGNLSILEKMKHLPVMIVTGDQDRLVPVANVRRWVARMKELEMKLTYNEIANGNHFGTITSNPKMMAEVFTFFDQHQRAATAATAEDNSYRVFTNKNGKTIKAKPVSLANGKISIAREDGKKFTVAVASLSEQDQKFIEVWADRKGRE